jgi:hypothetical protein
MKKKGYVLAFTVMSIAVLALAAGIIAGKQMGREEASENAAFQVGGAASTVLDAYYEKEELERAGILLKGCDKCRFFARELDGAELPLDAQQLTALFRELECENVLVRAEAVIEGRSAYRVTDAFCSVSVRVTGEP